MTTFNLKNQNRKSLFFRYIIGGLVLVPSEEHSTIVSTKSGKIRGKINDVLGVKVNTFLGIPYGKEPTGRLRFRRTHPVRPWTNTFDATRLPPACIQSEYTQRLFPVKILNWQISEDCLYMNIWSPVTNETSLPVMVWIHGGMFTIGSVGVDEYDGSVLASFGNVVVVSIQYRLGLFGFLDLENDEIPGNMGLYDQAMALKWINENIANFGGDPNLVTLFGQSAGGISIGMHMMAPQTKDLFKRVILQSGSPMLLNQVFTRGQKTAEAFVRKIDCFPEGTDIYDSLEMVVRCIDNTKLKKINDAQQAMVTNNPVPFLPTIPSEYIESFPTEDNENITFNQKEFLIGFNRDEGSLILHLSYPKNYTRTTVPTINTLEEARDTIIRMAVDGGFPETQAKSMASVLLNGNETDTPENWARKIGAVFGDIMFICPTARFADKFSALNSTVYMPQSSVWGKWMGVTHHDELNFVFGVPLRYPNMFDGEDINFSKRLMKTWTHFARTGSVSPIDYHNDWPPYDFSKPYMDLNTKNAYIGHRYHEETCNLYNALIEYFSR
ncbi:unnamed protein product [Oppiella nova]|uniref:Carboxylic ester hydrolase n=1 Tax=Oppiella nova TaxID=334625 RepID=A0A7R9QGQ6_9ACAR|nr:unnamed protein product [Oppiella nova]CAG2165402.1 unnamed protein product [Oppiella nova]